MSTSFRPEKIDYQKYICEMLACTFGRICALGSKARTINIERKIKHFFS